MDEKLETHPAHPSFCSDCNTETSLSNFVNYTEKYIYNKDPAHARNLDFLSLSKSASFFALIFAELI